jgi:hypothetical protein
MIFPLSHHLEISTDTNYLIAFMIGIGFGFFLEQGGFGNANKLAKTFYFRDMTVVKVMFTAIITAMIGLLALRAFGLINMQQIWINPSYIWPGIFGGLIMGVGFIVGGYCPGTGLVGMATLKVDAWVNVIGGAFGMFVAAEVIPHAYTFWKSSLIGERITLPEYFNISYGLTGFLVILFALAFFAFAEVMEKQFGNPEELQ